MFLVTMPYKYHKINRINHLGHRIDIRNHISFVTTDGTDTTGAYKACVITFGKPKLSRRVFKELDNLSFGKARCTKRVQLYGLTRGAWRLICI